MFASRSIPGVLPPTGAMRCNPDRPLAYALGGQECLASCPSLLNGTWHLAPRFIVSTCTHRILPEEKTSRRPRCQREQGCQVAHPAAMADTNTPPLRYRKRSIWLLAFYLPLLVVPWVLTCVLMFRPIFLPAYINQWGEYSMADMHTMENWRMAVDILNRIAATLGLPVVSALMAQAVVVYSQLRKAGDQKRLSALHLFALSDRGWMDLPILWTSFISAPYRGSRVLWLGAALVLISEPSQTVSTLRTVKLMPAAI